MDINVVIGNPPYNNDMYIPFVEMGHQLATDYSVFITPAKWQAKGGEKNEAFRQNIVPYMKDIVYYKDSTDVFDIEEWGGISYYTISCTNTYKTKNVKCECSKNNNLSCEFEVHQQDNLVLVPNSLYSIIEKCSGHTPLLKRFWSFKQALYVGKGIHGRDSKLYTDDVELMQGSRSDGYIRKSDLKTLIGIDTYRCVCGIMHGALNSFDTNGKVLGMTKFVSLKPMQVPIANFLSIIQLNSQSECDSFISYVQCKLIAFLYFLAVCGINVTPEFWRFIPDPGAFDHIFTDEELYKKYNITEEEINIIESVIKERK